MILTESEVHQIAMMFLEYLLRDEAELGKSGLLVFITQNITLINSMAAKAGESAISPKTLLEFGEGILNKTLTAENADSEELRTAFQFVRCYLTVGQVSLSPTTQKWFQHGAHQIGVSQKKMLEFANIILKEVVDDLFPTDPEPPKPGKGPAKEQNPPSSRKKRAA